MARKAKYNLAITQFLDILSCILLGWELWSPTCSSRSQVLNLKDSHLHVKVFQGTFICSVSLLCYRRITRYGQNFNNWILNSELLQKIVPYQWYIKVPFSTHFTLRGSTNDIQLLDRYLLFFALTAHLWNEAIPTSPLDWRKPVDGMMALGIPHNSPDIITGTFVFV